jgi:putative endonuclease
MNWFVYLLKCSDNSLYCGITNNLEKRLKTHLSGKGAKYTKSRLPVFLIYFEEFENKSKAATRENQIKRMSREQKIKLVKDRPENF